MTRTITVIGTGLMGSALARTFSQHGVDVTVWNRTAAKAKTLADRLGGVGVTPVEDFEQALRSSDLIYLQILDYDSARVLLESVPDDALHGRVVVAGMTGSSADARGLAEHVTGRGAVYLDACLELYPENIGSQEGVINYSGDEAAWAEWGPTLVKLAGGSAHIGADAALASLADAAIAGSFYNVALGAFLEAASFADKVGLSISQLEPFVLNMIELLKHVITTEAIPAIVKNDWGTDQATLDVYLRAVEIWREEMVLAGERANLMTANVHNLELARAAGHGSSSIYAEYLTARVEQRTSSKPN